MISTSGNRRSSQVGVIKSIKRRTEKPSTDIRVSEGSVLRIPGSDPTTSAIVVHGHLDVVPAIAQDWCHPPFAAEVDSRFIWGRGAVDMKSMDAMILAVVRHWARAVNRIGDHRWPIRRTKTVDQFLASLLDARMQFPGAGLPMRYEILPNSIVSRV